MAARDEAQKMAKISRQSDPWQFTGEVQCAYGMGQDGKIKFRVPLIEACHGHNEVGHAKSQELVVQPRQIDITSRHTDVFYSLAVSASARTRLTYESRNGDGKGF